MSAEFQAYLVAEKNLDSAQEAIASLADTLANVAAILRNDPARFARPNPNFSETRSDGHMSIDEPIDMAAIPEPLRGHLVSLAKMLFEAQKKLVAAKAALPPEMASRLTRPRA